MIPRVNAKLFFGIIIMLILQVFLAPIIQIDGILPNFIIAFMVAIACAQPYVPFLWFTCLAGVLFDLACGVTVGTLSIVLVATVFLLTTILRKIETHKASLIIAAMILAIMFAESLYGAFQSILGSQYTFIDLFFARILPCTIFDTIIALLIFPLALKMFSIITIEEPRKSRPPREQING